MWKRIKYIKLVSWYSRAVAVVSAIAAAVYYVRGWFLKERRSQEKSQFRKERESQEKSQLGKERKFQEEFQFRKERKFQEKPQRCKM